MATIPIEVIVQDAEAPIVPSEDGTNTNITVPDTGTINSNGDTSSSASSIILPAIIVVLAIGAIVAMLVHKHRKHTNSAMSKKEKLATAASGTIAILAATVLVGNLVIPATKAATSDITDGITPAEDKVSIVVTRDGGVAETSIESTATITSTSDFGYKVLLSMAEGVETSNLYLDGDEESEYYIASVEAENEEGVELANNTWGYALIEDGKYSAVPLLDDAVIVAQGDEPVEDELLSIYYGVKVGSDLPAGAYSGGEIEYNLVSLEPTINTLTYMQDFAKLSESGKASVLRSMTENEQYTLKDSRDNKDYFISKLADGNVWMTQNLDLDIEVPAEGSIVYDSTNTNLPAGTTWEPERATLAKDNLSSDTWKEDNNNPYSYDPGEIYYYTSDTTSSDIQYNSLVECIAASHTAAECRHYHAGNYYNWTAAIASNDSSTLTEAYENATTSVCPAGWRLPFGTAGDNDTAATREFGQLFYAYDITASLTSTSFNAEGLNTLRSSPLYFIRSGNVTVRGDSGRTAVSDSRYLGNVHSATVASDRQSYVAQYYEYYFIKSATKDVRASGLSIRCLAQ